jgi:DNA-binding NtrC family response regulator
VEQTVLPLPNPQMLQKTILIVEDHFETRWTAAEYMRHRGYKVIEAVNATEALSLAASGVSIDAVFSDVYLGNGDSGYDLAQWFAKHRSLIPVLLTSGADQGCALATDELRRFVRKPYDLRQVEQLLRSMLEQS